MEFIRSTYDGLVSVRWVLILTFTSFLGGNIYTQPISAPLVDPITVPAEDRIENQRGKTILIFSPYPDDETFSMGGTLAQLVENQNEVHVVIYTNDNKGSLDLEMTSERLARIRRAEEEASCKILGIVRDNIHWLGYEDGDLEYADPFILRGRVARHIKKYRPDVVFSPDPGSKWTQWHKSDHRMAAIITQDAYRAAEWHLYYPQHLLDEDLKPYYPKEIYYYYSQEPNYEVDISKTFDLKIQASAAHVSQFEPSTTKYTPVMSTGTFEQIRTGFTVRNKSESGALVERFRKVN